MDADRPPSEDPAPTRSAPWNRRAVVLFAIILTALTGIGLANWLYRPAPPKGLPQDAAVKEALELLEGALRVDVGDMRFVTSLGDGGDFEPLPDSARARHLAGAAFRLEQAHARSRFDPRIECLLGHVALASDRLGLAERRYRSALSLNPGYGEARLGLAITLARRATGEDDRGSARGHRLEAIAQLAAIGPRGPFALPALYDRVLLLLDVGRVEEARRLTEHYEQLEPGSAWTGVLRRKFDAIDSQRPS
jgi:hypothetical protein